MRLAQIRQNQEAWNASTPARTAALLLNILAQIQVIAIHDLPPRGKNTTTFVVDPLGFYCVHDIYPKGLPR
jgi:hypothetical protein